ncbi:hypothetical protein GCK72_010484 [Caenorhabditis remanei]|uniref:Uncharacterized protein n=1 Tax=Caenorhabditis remanei TaxID=31234 RepID=A0A6A5H771_CAERE|nr:hypothetical protein GCK72_010484 [Caenorhabditis remanei]KAF1762222.1 hypothetical protein GCK72_010484 [Caenorhabditis remanei]
MSFSVDACVVSGKSFPRDLTISENGRMSFQNQKAGENVPLQLLNWFTRRSDTSSNNDNIVLLDIDSLIDSSPLLSS